MEKSKGFYKQLIKKLIKDSFKLGSLNNEADAERYLQHLLSNKYIKSENFAIQDAFTDGFMYGFKKKSKQKSLIVKRPYSITAAVYRLIDKKYKSKTRKSDRAEGIRFYGDITEVMDIIGECHELSPLFISQIDEFIESLTDEELELVTHLRNAKSLNKCENHQIVAKIYGVSESTIRNRIKQLVKRMNDYV